VKSDVYSFGIMVLEIISGKRKGCPAESECVDDIRRYVSETFRRLLLNRVFERIIFLINK